MPGTRSLAQHVIAMLAGYASAAVVANQYLGEWPITQACVLGGVKVNAGTAGTGSGNTVVDVLLNGESVYRLTADRPTLAATSTGEFASVVPVLRRLGPGDVLAIRVISVSTSGHARLGASVALELAQRRTREAI